MNLNEFIAAYPTEHFFSSGRGERLKIRVDHQGQRALVLAGGLSPRQDARVNTHIFYPVDRKATIENTSRISSSERLQDIRIFSPEEALDFVVSRLAWYESDLTPEEVEANYAESLRLGKYDRPPLNQMHRDDRVGVERTYDLLRQGEFKAAYDSWRDLNTMVRGHFLPRLVAWMDSKANSKPELDICPA